jgi:hypothetical protein
MMTDARVLSRTNLLSYLSGTLVPSFSSLSGTSFTALQPRYELRTGEINDGFKRGSIPAAAAAYPPLASLQP